MESADRHRWMIWLIRADSIITVSLLAILIVFLAACFTIDYGSFSSLGFTKRAGVLIHDFYLDVPVLLLTTAHVLIRAKFALRRWGAKRDRLINTALILLGATVAWMVAYINYLKR
jgi:hypothetical protein